MTAEPIEILLVLTAGLAFSASVWLCWRSVPTARAAVASGRCEAVRTLAWLRVRSEALRAVVVGLVLVAGWLQVIAPPPDVPGPYRAYLQVAWVLIAGLNLVQSVWVEETIRYVIRVIERERAERGV